VFCPIASFEQVLRNCHEDDFLAVLSAASEERYFGWDLVTIRGDQPELDPKQSKPFPFSLSELLPWWDRAHEFEATQTPTSTT
jgi:hypothetical protein